jgi:hypothetical protein
METPTRIRFFLNPLPVRFAPGRASQTGLGRAELARVDEGKRSGACFDRVLRLALLRDSAQLGFNSQSDLVNRAIC